MPTAVDRSEGTFPSCSGLANIYYRVWKPVNKSPKAAVQIVHGMAEHGERYEGFASALCAAGFDVWVTDLLGHGKSAENPGQWGWFGEERGWKNLIGDIHLMTRIMNDAYPEGMPIFLYGHSMGSFLARAYCERWSEDLAGAAFCGTSGPNPAASAGVLVAKLTAALQGGMHRSALLDNIAFGAYNKKYPGTPRTKFDWLNTDETEVDKYIEDERCGFLFTAKGYVSLFELLRSVSGNKWFTSMPYQLPILVIGGDEDPVTGYGKGMEQVARKLREAGCNRVTLSVFPGLRHEILLSPEKEQVYDTVIQWLLGALEPDPA